VHLDPFRSPSSWLPCREGPNALYTFDLEFTCAAPFCVVSTGAASNPGGTISDPGDSWGGRVSGHRARGPLRLFRFHVRCPIQARGLGFACGSYDRLEVPPPAAMELAARGIPVEIYVPWAATHVKLGRIKKLHMRAKALATVSQTKTEMTIFVFRMILLFFRVKCAVCARQRCGCRQSSCCS
jgi:hypothetical protein